MSHAVTAFDSRAAGEFGSVEHDAIVSAASTVHATLGIQRKGVLPYLRQSFIAPPRGYLPSRPVDACKSVAAIYQVVGRPCYSEWVTSHVHRHRFGEQAGRHD